MGDGGEHEIRVTDRGEGNQDDAVSEGVRCLHSDGEGEAGLADAAGSR